MTTKPTDEQIRELEAKIAEVVFGQIIYDKNESPEYYPFDEPNFSMARINDFVTRAMQFTTDAHDWEMLVDELAGIEFITEDGNKSKIAIEEWTQYQGHKGHIVYWVNIYIDISEVREEGFNSRQAARYHALTEALPTIEQLIKEKG